MPVTLDLPDEAVERLRVEAARRGVDIEVVVLDLVAQMPEARPEQREFGFLRLGASTSGRTAAEADEMLDEGFGRS